MKDNTELDKISYIDKYINESKEIIKSNNMEAAKRKQKNIIAIFGNNIQGIKVGLTNYDVESMYNRGNINYIEDLKLLIKKLEFYKIEENEGKSLSKNIICNQNIIENNIKIDTEINNTLKECRKSCKGNRRCQVCEHCEVETEHVGNQGRDTKLYQSRSCDRRCNDIGRDTRKTHT